MSGSTGKGRLYRVRRYPTLRGRLGLPDVEAPARVVANDTFWGGFAPAPTQIPYDWLTPPARWRSDQPRNVAPISRTGGSTARAVNAASVAAVGERQFSATLDSGVVDDPKNYADWIVANYVAPRQRMPQLRLNLLPRTPTECWRILERQIGDRISIVGAPADRIVEVSDGFGRVAAADWTTADTGQPWTLTATAADYQVTGARGRITTTTVAQLYLALIDTGSTDHQVQETITCPVVPTGAGFTLRALARATADGLNFYNASLTIGVGGAATLSLTKSVGGSGSVINAGVTVGTHAAGDSWMLVLDASGSVLSARAWNIATTTDPVVWQVTATDTSLTTGTLAGVGVRRETGNLDGAVPIEVDNFTATTANPTAWPAGITELVIEGVEHFIDGAGTRWVTWNTAPLIGAQPGQAGPWFRADQSTTDTGSDVLAF